MLEQQSDAMIDVDAQPGKYALAAATRRVLGKALIIAHATYPGMHSMPGVRQDMVRMAKLLATYGYHVNIWFELSQIELERSWEDWVHDNARPETPLFVYFSGRGYITNAARAGDYQNYNFELSSGPFRPFDCDNLRKEFQHSSSSTCSCIVCIDTCLTPASAGLDATLISPARIAVNGAQPVRRAAMSLEKTHHTVTVLYNPSAHTPKDDSFTRNFEAVLPRMLRAVTQERVSQIEFEIRHDEIIQKFQDTRQPFVQTEKRITYPAFLVDTLSFGQQLLHTQPDPATIDWVRKHFRQFLEAQSHEIRRWGWIAQIVSMQNIGQLIASVDALDHALSSATPPERTTIEQALQQLESSLSHRSTEPQPYRDLLLNMYRLEAARWQYTRNPQAQPEELEGAAKRMAQVFQLYGSLEALCNALGYTAETFLGKPSIDRGLCQRLLSHVGRIPPDKLSDSTPTIYQHVIQILEACKHEDFADHIHLLRQIDHYNEKLKASLAQLTRHSSASPARREVTTPLPFIDDLYRKPSFWVIGLLLYIAVLVLNEQRTPWQELLHFDQRYGQLQKLMLFGGAYVVITTLVFYLLARDKIGAPRFSLRQWWLLLVMSCIASISLGEITLSVLMIQSWMRIGVWLVFLILGLVICWLALHEYES